jgi:hypothetical protein
LEGLADGTITHSRKELRSADSSLLCIDLGINPVLFKTSFPKCLLKRSSTYCIMIAVALIIRIAFRTIVELQSNQEIWMAGQWLRSLGYELTNKTILGSHLTAGGSGNTWLRAPKCESGIDFHLRFWYLRLAPLRSGYQTCWSIENVL